MAATGKRAAAQLPVARVAVDNPLPHLDRPFDYLVEESQDVACRPGCRVRVRFAGKLLGGFVLERVNESEYRHRLAYLERVVSPEVVLTPEIARLARTVADRYAGTFADVTRLAVPPRHAAAEKSQVAASQSDMRATAPAPAEVWRDYDGADAMFSDATNRAVATLLPGDWPYMLASLLANTASRGRGAVLVVPDHRDVARVRAALAQLLSPSQFVALTADLGPAARYREFLRISRGQARCVVGTRAAIWAPVHDLGLVAVWDDGDDLHAEPRAPYCHAREVGVARAHLADASLLLAGHAMSAEGALLVESGWARILRPSRAAAVATLPAMRASGDDDELARDAAARAARLPSLAWHAARDALAADAPVLVQVPRRGYQLSLLCQSCRKSARCSRCAGPLARPGAHAVPACRWCNIAAVDWTCPSCGSHQLRAAVVGAARTAEELGRAFPGVTVRISGGDHIIADVPAKAQLVVATPGAEPLAAGGYGAALLLDGWALLARPELRAGEEALRRWLNAAALVRNAAGGGRVVVVAAGEMRPVQALLRWRPDWHAARELDDRAALHLPPAGRIAAVTGAAGAVNELLELAELPAHAELLGPVEIAGRGNEREQRMLIRVPRGDGAALAATLRQSAAARSARKSAGAVRIEIDPLVLG